MKKHFFAASLLSILVLTIGAFSLNSNSALADPNAQAAGLASLLPPSQLVATLDAKRFFNEAVPRILTAKPELLAQFNSVLGEVQANTGIDLRQFDTVAIGANFSSKGAGSFDLDPVVLARGQVNANAIIGAAKLGGGKYKQEQVGGRTLYIFTVTRKAKDDKAGTAKPRTMEVAATAFDANTVAIGTPLRVRELIDAKA